MKKARSEATYRARRATRGIAERELGVSGEITTCNDGSCMADGSNFLSSIVHA